MSNLLIVESCNDEFFINRLLQVLNLSSEIKVGSPVCHIDEYQCLNGLSETLLSNKLKEIEIEIEKRGIEKIGILLDADKDGIESKLRLLNHVLNQIDSTICIEHVNQWVYSHILDVRISCHVLNVDGHGELETLLRKIKLNNSTFADCLHSWRECLSEHAEAISDKEFDKFWVNIYQRYDTCTKKERKQAARKCSFKASLQKDIWDFSSCYLDSLKGFLLSFV